MGGRSGNNWNHIVIPEDNMMPMPTSRQSSTRDAAGSRRHGSRRLEYSGALDTIPLHGTGSRREHSGFLDMISLRGTGSKRDHSGAMDSIPLFGPGSTRSDHNFSGSIEMRGSRRADYSGVLGLEELRDRGRLSDFDRSVFGSFATSVGTVDESTCFSCINLDELENSDMRAKIAKAPSRKVREIAFVMYRLLRQNGLLAEAQKSFEHLHNNRGHRESGMMISSRPDKEPVLGVEHMLKHGLVNFLRDLARLSPPIPHQVVRFKGISYSVQVQEEVSGFETFGNKLLGCLLGPFKGLVKKKVASVSHDVLKDVSGYFMPGSMTLLLGPPGSGKSSLLKVLAGRARNEKLTKMRGIVTYNDREVAELLNTRLIAYINGQNNCHSPFLTVRETLEFAEDCTQLGLRPENFPPHMRKVFAYALVEGEDPYLEYILRVLGLKNIENAIIGRSRKDGIDDFERNRLTTAEIAMGTYAVMIYDQPCLGQDPLATYDLVHTLRAVNRIQQSSAVISLVQVAPEVFDLFDRVILLGDGHILYQGPRQDAINYFAQHGYRKPPHVDPGAFLQDIAGGYGSQYLESESVPHTVDELSELYKNSHLHKDIMRIVTREDVPHTFWVESNADVELSFGFTSYVDTTTNEEHQAAEVIVAHIHSQIDHARGIESTGRLTVGDKVTAISTPEGSMHYIAVVPESDPNNHATTINLMLKNSPGLVRLQVERQETDMSEEDKEAHAKFNQEYVQGWWQSTYGLIKRQWKITRRLKILIILRLLQVIILGFFGGTIFLHMGGSVDSLKMNAIRGMGFVSSMTVLLINLVQQPVNMLQRPVLYKQRAQRFYRISSYLVADFVISLPQSLLEVFLYSLGAYFLANLSRTGHWEHYFQYLLVLWLVAYMGSSMVRFTSSVAPLLEAANALASLFVAVFLLFSGFVIYPHNVPPFWKWMLYANPLHWAIVVYGVIEIGEEYKEPCLPFSQTKTPFDQFCHSYPEMTFGNAFLKFYGLRTERHLVWVGYAVIIAWILLFQILSYIALKKIQHMEVNTSLPRQKPKAHVYSNLEEDNEASDLFSEEFIVTAAKQNSANRNKDKRLDGNPQPLDGKSTSQINGIGKPVVPSAPKLTPFAMSFLRRQDELHPNENYHPRNEASISSYIPGIKPITLSFRNIGLTVKDMKSKRDVTLLSGISGYAKPGRMLALVGSSSAGAAPLLKCLSGRVNTGKIDGEIFVNGAKLSNHIFSKISGYAESLDAHQPYLTVRESLEFSATLRLGARATHRQKVFLVDLIIELMGLSEVSNLLVGELRYSTGRTYELSKKLTIAVELAANPSILFLDNPTSNLDSVGARNVMYAMKAVAGTGRTVISTVRHPSARMLSVFNKVLILNNNGEQVYFGPVGWNCNKLVSYFLSIPKVPKYDEKQNPITYVLDLLGAGIRKRKSVQNFKEIYLESQLGKKNEAEISKMCADAYAGGEIMYAAPGYPASYWKQATTVFLRTQRFLYRNVQYTFGRLAGSIALGLLLGSVYFQIHWGSSISMTSRSLFTYIQVLLIGVMNANNVIPQLGSDRMAYFREKRANMYAPIFYPVAWAVSEIPYIILITLAFVAIGNGMAGIAVHTVGTFLEYWFGLFLFTLTVTYFGIFLTLATPVPMLAAFAMSIFLSMWITGSGVVIPKIRIHFYNWLYWSNPFQYAINALTSISFYCNTQASVCQPPICQAGRHCPPCPCKQLSDVYNLYVWDRLKKLRSLDHQRLPYDYAFLGGTSLVLAALCVLCFVFLKHNSKPSS